MSITELLVEYEGLFISAVGALVLFIVYQLTKSKNPDGAPQAAPAPSAMPSAPAGDGAAITAAIAAAVAQYRQTN